MRNYGKSSMITGIVGVVYGVLLGWLFPLPALALGVVGLIDQAKAEKGGMATAGLVLGVINTSLAGIATLWWVLFVGLAALGSAA